MMTETATERADIYSLLGITSDASLILAREMYWTRVGVLVEEERNGNADVRMQIAALNDALEIIVDADRRAEYDAARPSKAAPEAVAADVLQREAAPTGQNPVFILAAMVGVAMLLTVGGFAFVTGEFTFVTLGTAAAGLVIAAFSLLGLRQSRAARAFQELRLGTAATIDELTVAYETRAHELLIELKRNPADEAPVQQLEALDRSYLEAMAALVEREEIAAAAVLAAEAPARTPAPAVEAPAEPTAPEAPVERDDDVPSERVEPPAESADTAPPIEAELPAVEDAPPVIEDVPLPIEEAPPAVEDAPSPAEDALPPAEEAMPPHEEAPAAPARPSVVVRAASGAGHAVVRSGAWLGTSLWAGTRWTGRTLYAAGRRGGGLALRAAGRRGDVARGVASSSRSAVVEVSGRLSGVAGGGQAAPAPPSAAQDAVSRRLQGRLSNASNAIAAASVRAQQEEPPSPDAAPPAEAALIATADGVPSRTPISDRPVRIGSGPAADLRLSAADAAGEQATVWRQGGGLVLHVTGDAVCLVNGDPATWSLLEHGDVLTFGSIDLRVEEPGPA